MRRILSNICLLASASAFAVSISTRVSIMTHKWHWFGRSGAVLTMAGVILSFRPIMRMGLDGWLESQSVIDGGHVVPTPEEIKADHQAQLDGKASQTGIIMAIVGTLIWAYGDLVGGLP